MQIYTPNELAKNFSSLQKTVKEENPGYIGLVRYNNDRIYDYRNDDKGELAIVLRDSFGRGNLQRQNFFKEYEYNLGINIALLVGFYAYECEDDLEPYELLELYLNVTYGGAAAHSSFSQFASIRSRILNSLGRSHEEKVTIQIKAERAFHEEILVEHIKKFEKELDKSPSLELIEAIHTLKVQLENLHEIFDSIIARERRSIGETAYLQLTDKQKSLIKEKSKEEWKSLNKPIEPVWAA